MGKMKLLVVMLASLMLSTAMGNAALAVSQADLETAISKAESVKSSASAEDARYLAGLISVANCKLNNFASASESELSEVLAALNEGTRGIELSQNMNMTKTRKAPDSITKSNKVANTSAKTAVEAEKAEATLAVAEVEASALDVRVEVAPKEEVTEEKDTEEVAVPLTNAPEDVNANRIALAAAMGVAVLTVVLSAIAIFGLQERKNA